MATANPSGQLLNKTKFSGVGSPAAGFNYTVPAGRYAVIQVIYLFEGGVSGSLTLNTNFPLFSWSGGTDVYGVALNNAGSSVFPNSAFEFEMDASDNLVLTGSGSYYVSVREYKKP